MDEIQNLLSVKGIKPLQASTLYGAGLVDSNPHFSDGFSVSVLIDDKPSGFMEGGNTMEPVGDTDCMHHGSASEKTFLLICF
jgi:hypothetical protein